MNIHDYMDRPYPGVTCVECGAEPAQECGLPLQPWNTTLEELAAETQRRDREWRQALARAQP
jgi:hypothetical protein